MGISVQVRTFTGAVEATCVHPFIADLCERAASQHLPLLGYVDPYDDTVFNRSQLRVLIPELRSLADGSAAEEAEVVHEILALAAQVERKAHRYLVFNGD
ncbi:hypothetical protein ACPCAB_05205 [Streptomyces koyangensis]|uniref:Uncharacterized protein n=1 Tax=Streptomyces koyangensis TaxID=188770 RepID=A0ABX7EHH5_9ACTN|nr:hypothetical protein [Streptomyces koyangensis]QRF03165.1 hypothetical protein G9U55_13770 [Streptomyces koyangensis]QRF04073.1 hypothetical protein G9U55_19045 [Streptomyces koyangensis]